MSHLTKIQTYLWTWNSHIEILLVKTWDACILTSLSYSDMFHTWEDFSLDLILKNPKQCLRDYTTMPRSNFSNAGSIILKVHVYLFTLLG